MQTAQQPIAAQAPEKRRVHHSYIWLGGISTAFWIVFAVALACIGSVSSLVEEGVLGRPGAGAVAGLVGIAIAGIVVLAAGLGIGLRAIAYKCLWYELDGSELSLYSGFISKRRTHVPYQKIQSVDMKATLVQRVFGLCNVVIDTAGGASNKAIVIPYLTKQAASSLKGELYARKSAVLAPAAQETGQVGATGDALGYAPPSGMPVAVAAPAPTATVATGNVLDVGDEAWRQFDGVFGAQEMPQEAASFEYGLTNKEILFTGMSNSSGVIAGMVGALFAGLVTVFPIVSAVLDSVPDAANAAAGMVAHSFVTSALQSLLPAAIALLVGLALVIWVIASLAACIQFGGFKARRRGSRIEVERGLLQHNAISLDIDRVQSVIVSQSMIRRLAGYCEVSLGKVDAAEQGSGQSGSNAKSLSESGFVIHPFVKVNRVSEILHGMVPEYADLPKEQSKLAPVALRRGLIRRCILFGGGFWLAVVVAIAQFFVHLAAVPGSFEDAGIVASVDFVAGVLYVVAVVLLALNVVGTVLWFKGSRFATSRTMVALTNAGLGKSTVAVPRVKVQFGSTKANPLQRRAGTSTVLVTTAAGVGGTSNALVDVPASVADAWLEWVEPKRPQASFDIPEARNAEGAPA